MHKQSWVAWAVGILAAGLAALVIAPNFMRMTDDNAEPAFCKQNLHAISLALERYAVDNAGNYPATLQPLRDEAYLPHLPDNPYDRTSPRGPMPEVPLGQHAAGGVTYLPHFVAPATNASRVDGYALLVYGDEHASKAMRVAHASQRCVLPNGTEARVAWDNVLLVISKEAPPAEPPAPSH